MNENFNISQTMNVLLYLVFNNFFLASHQALPMQCLGGLHLTAV